MRHQQNYQTPAKVEYKKNAGRITKKEANMLSAMNRKMTDWVRKTSLPDSDGIMVAERIELEIASDMEWEDAPDIDRAWRVSVAKDKSEASRKKYQTKVMVEELVNDMIRMVEPTLVV